MAKKKSGDANDAIRLKAKQMREAQERADRRTRNIIISVVVVIVVAIIAALAFTVQSQKDGGQSQSGSAAGIPAQFANGEPIVVSDLGVGTRNDKLQDLNLYFSYTCHWCGILEEKAGQALFDDAKAGKYNLILHPVNAANMPWIGPSTSAALVTAASEPEKFIAFHQSMFTYFMEQYTAQDGSVIANASASKDKVAELAKTAGISDATIAKFGDNVDSYLAQTSLTWQEGMFEGRSKDIGTPELVFNNTVIQWNANTPEEVHKKILSGMTAAGFKQQ